MHNKLTVLWLSLLITGSIDSIRNLPTTALFGGDLFFFVIAGTVFFLLPTALISAQLTTIWPTHGGIYDWVKHTLGVHAAFIAIWLQWFNTVVWFPTILAFIAGTIAFVVDPALAHNKLFLTSCMLAIFWAMTIINLYGIQTSARVASICTIIGMVIPVILIVGCGIAWLMQGKELALNLHDITQMPRLGNINNWGTLTGVMASFLGMELATVHIASVERPRYTFPLSLLISVILILATVLFGSLAIAIVVPTSKLALISGVIQTFQYFLYEHNLAYLLPLIALLLAIGSVGGMINWIISPPKGLLQAAQDGFLPKILTYENRNTVPRNMLLVQACLVSIISISFLYFPTVNSGYWFLTDLSTQLYMVMYILMFLVGIKVAGNLDAFEGRLFKSKYTLYLISLIGIAGCLLSIAVGFIPPEQVIGWGGVEYTVLFSVSMLGVLVVGFSFFLYYNVNDK